MSIKKPILIILGLGAVGALTLLIFLGVTFNAVSNTENIKRAQATYEKGELLFKQANYRKAMWEYQMVSEFYSKPHTTWMDLAQEKEWTCRALLNDWTPPEGPLDKDVRLLHPDLYNKYKVKLLQITPVPEPADTTK